MSAPTTKSTKMIPPDGGWGWMAVLGVAIVTMTTRSVELSFGLLFADLLEILNVKTTGATLIMSIMDAVYNLSGLLVGPVCKYLSFRKVAILGCILNAFGLILTFPATTMLHIILTYSVMGAVGTGLAISSTFVVLNHYFIRKRGLAVGLSQLGGAVGIMIYPQIVRLLLEEFDFRSGILILGAINLNAVVGACLLQPVKWHLKSACEENKEEPESVIENDKENSNQKIKRDSMFGILHTENEKGESQILINGPNLENEYKNIPQNNMEDHNDEIKRNSIFEITRSENNNSETEVLINSSPSGVINAAIQISSESDKEKIEDDKSKNFYKNIRTTNSASVNSIEQIIKQVENPSINKTEDKQTFWNKFYKFFDFDLLTNGIYLNILLALSLYYLAEQNFKVVTPFFFFSLGYSKADTAFFLSASAAMDVGARIILPSICDYLVSKKIRRKTMFMVAIFFLAIGRSLLAEQTEYYPLLTWMGFSGFCRGAAIVNFFLVVSEWCPTLEKLPAAFGLKMVSKGVFVILFGPLLGYLRDETRSYPFVIHVSNALLLLAVLVWIIEYTYIYCFKSRQNSKDE